MKTKVNIFSPGRFHVCDLARELDRNGFDVKFYSFVPTKRAEKYGLPRQCSASLFVPMMPFLALWKLSHGATWANVLKTKFQDWLSSVVMRKADVCICMSGSFLVTPRKAKRKGEIVILERGSKHILEQRRILDSIPSNKGKVTVPDINVKRELAGYDIADYIAVATQHVVDSFKLHNYPIEKLFVNPYGVDLSDFYPFDNVTKKYDLIMVGGWCYRKGCDLIVEAVRLTSCSFLHVGSLGDMPFPNESNFTLHDAVDQKDLVNFYNQAKVTVFPSREDGFGMVLSQAVACNLPITGSRDSGAPDLKRMVELPEYITLIDEYTPEAVASGIKTALANYDKLGGKVYAGDAISNLTWEAYGKRYASFLNNINSQTGGGNY